MKLINRNFVILMQGMFISHLGSVIFEIGLAFYIFKYTDSAFLMSLIIALEMLPCIIISPFTGIIVDKLNKKQVICICDLIDGLAIISIAIMFMSSKVNIPWLITLVVLQSLTDAFFTPAIQCILPKLVDESLMLRASGINSNLHTLSSVSGKFLGGILIALISFPLLLLLNGLTYLISGITEMFLDIEEPELIDRTLDFRNDFKKTFDFLKQNGEYTNLISFWTIYSLFSSIISVALIAYFAANHSSVLYGSTSGIYLLGVFVSGLFINFFGKKIKNYHIVFFLSFGMGSLFYCIFIFSSHTIVIVLSFFLIGLSLGISGLIFDTIRIISVVPDIRGSVYSITFSVMSIFTPIGNVLGGKIVDILNPSLVVILSSAILLILTFAYASNRKLRTFFNVELALKN